MTDLYKEEYQTLRKEVEIAMSELNTLESGALFASATIFAWLVTQKSEGVIRIGWFIPSMLVLFGILRAWSINRHLGWLGDYLKTHESAYVQPQLRGWEYFLSDPVPGSNTPRRGFRGKVTYWFWAVLFLVTIAGAFMGSSKILEAHETTKCEAKDGGLTGQSTRSPAAARDLLH